MRHGKPTALLLASLLLGAPAAFAQTAYSSRGAALTQTESGRNDRTTFNQLIYADTRLNPGSLGSSATARATLDATGRPFVLSEAVGSAPSPSSSSIAQASAQTEMVYEFSVGGPTTTVPVLVSAAGDFLSSAISNALGTGNVVAGISFDFRGPNPAGGIYGARDQVNLQYSRSGIAAQTLLGGATLSGTIDTGFTATILQNTVYNLEVGAVYRIGIFAEATGVSGGNGFIGGQSFDVRSFVDPYVSIAPGTPNAALYSFAFSPGVGNLPTPVPEPAAWALMLGGLGGIAAVGVRRRRTARPGLST